MQSDDIYRVGFFFLSFIWYLGGSRVFERKRSPSLLELECLGRGLLPESHVFLSTITMM